MGSAGEILDCYLTFARAFPELKDTAQTLQAFVAIIGILVGAVWTYRLYVRQRLHFPRVVPELACDVVKLSRGSSLLHATVRLANQGSVLFRSASAELRLRQVVPVPAGIAASLKRGDDPVPKERAQIEWPLLRQRDWKWSPGDFEIEPGETDFLHADFFVPPGVKVVELYFYLDNPRKKGVGWTTTTIRDLRQQERKERGMARETTGPRGDRETLQQRQQAKQPTQIQQVKQPTQEPPPQPTERK